MNEVAVTKLSEEEITKRRAEIAEKKETGRFMLFFGIIPYLLMFAGGYFSESPREAMDSSLLFNLGFMIFFGGTIWFVPFWPFIGTYLLMCARTESIRLRYELLGYGYYQ